MAMKGMHGNGRYAWQWEACIAVRGMHGNGRHAWQWEACMAVRGMYGSERHAWQWEACMAMGGIRQWEVYGSGRYTAVGDKGKKGHLSRTALIA
jgi:hypothetical protein